MSVRYTDIDRPEILTIDKTIFHVKRIHFLPFLFLYLIVFYASQCEVLLGSVFSPCHGYISPSIYQQQCRYQACRCGSSCLCTALAHYAYLCSKHININFRSQVSECGTCLASRLLACFQLKILVCV